MARGSHNSPQHTTYSKRKKSLNKTQKLIDNNRLVLSKLK